MIFIHVSRQISTCIDNSIKRDRAFRVLGEKVLEKNYALNKFIFIYWESEGFVQYQNFFNYSIYHSLQDSIDERKERETIKIRRVYSNSGSYLE